ncbi:ABCB family ABC transporter ATP-binding protein/permease [Marinivivus vitaminiproducens]|uniref:ABCB family ABC transporter ATP-binding protein/permease n=1 Tax=Marinivivus vitaminiproducens TaxID=3035935 RepID=UPI0027A81ED5|nr:ABC transporter ATP-binding protein/permease [Geminicoccaceae bacterium SCSIO 64248]
MTPTTASRHRLGRAFGQLLPYLWPRDQRALRRRVVFALACLLLAKGINLAIPFAFKDVIDRLGMTGPALALPLVPILAYAGARLGNALFSELRAALFSRVAIHAGRGLALRVYRHLIDLSLRYHLERRTGELARVIGRGVEAVSFILGMILFNIVPTLVEFALVIGILLVRYDARYAGIVAGTIAAYAVFTVLFSDWRSRLRRVMNEHDNEVNARTVDGLINYETIKSFTNEAYEARRLDEALGGYEVAASRSRASLSALNFGQAAIVALGVGLLMLLAAQEVVAGRLTVGDVVLMNTFLLQLYAPLDALGMVYRELKQSLTDLENIDGILSTRPEIADRPEARSLDLRAGRVAFEDVRFAYDPRRPVLDGVGFAVEPGQTVAVVGASGAGKSTLVRLLFRFYDLDGGRIRIDGQDIRDVTQRSLREAIGVVPQDTVLFNDTIGVNIAYGRPDADRFAVEQAAELAQIHDFILSLPDGYDTLVGERGLKLSGGEKQRVAIARMALKNPPILLLDEATSALDTLTEQAIQGALRRLSAGRTTLVIAHRLSTVADADRILVMDEGRIVEQGRHDALIREDGVYARLWRRQTPGHDRRTVTEAGMS